MEEVRRCNKEERTVFEKKENSLPKQNCQNKRGQITKKRRKAEQGIIKKNKGRHKERGARGRLQAQVED